MVADDRFAVLVVVDQAAIEVNAEAADVWRVPSRFGHLFAAGIEPDYFRRLVAANRFTVEEAAAMEAWLRVPDLDHLLGELK